MNEKYILRKFARSNSRSEHQSVSHSFSFSVLAVESFDGEHGRRCQMESA